MAKLLIIGPGAVGAALGAALVQRGHAVGYCGRAGPVAAAFHLEAGAQAGMAGASGAYHLPAPDPDFLRRVELVLIAVKAFDLVAALQAMASVAPAAPVVTVGNGSLEALVAAVAATMPERSFRLGSVTVGVSEVDSADALPAFSVRSTAGVVAFGPFVGPEPAPTACEFALTHGDPLFLWETAAVHRHRRKWLYNTVINSLCAARRLPRNGDLLERREELDAVFSEAYRLGESLWGTWLESHASLHDGLLELIRSTQRNENSMARDVRLGMRTESDFLAGLAGGDARFPRLNALHAWINAQPTS